MANMAWAVEATVQSASGDPRSRRDEPQPAPRKLSPKPPAELQYRLATTVPRYWIRLFQFQRMATVDLFCVKER